MLVRTYGIEGSVCIAMYICMNYVFKIVLVYTFLSDNIFIIIFVSGACLFLTGTAAQPMLPPSPTSPSSTATRQFTKQSVGKLESLQIA